MNKVTLWLVTIFLVSAVEVVEAEQPMKIPRIGYLSGNGSEAPTAVGFRQGLRDLGYIAGKNILIGYRDIGVTQERIPHLVGELVQLKVDVLVVSTGTTIRAAKQATKTIPIVMVTTEDPVATGLIDTLAHPGRNITGLTLLTRERLPPATPKKICICHDCGREPSLACRGSRHSGTTQCCAVAFCAAFPDRNWFDYYP